MKQTLLPGLVLVMAAAAPVEAGHMFPGAGHVFLTGQINNVDGDSDGFVDDASISQVVFSVTAGTLVEFDTLVWENTGFDWNNDGRITGFDMLLRLYDDAGNVLSANDDRQSTTASIDKNGSIHKFDSVFKYTFEQAGTYTLALGQVGYNKDDGLLGYQANRPFYDRKGGDDPYGAWGLDMTWSEGDVTIDPHPTPEPGTLALLTLGGVGLLAARYRKRRGLKDEG
jgi:hypothetical protein